MALGMNQKGFFPGQLNLCRTSGKISNHGCKMLNGHILLAAEAAANQGVLNLYLICSENHLTFMKGLMGRLIR